MNIKKIGENIFSGLNSTKVLKIKYNLINTIEANGFRGLSKLTELYFLI